MRIFFSHKGVKLFKNEPHKKFLSGRWQVIKNLGYPYGSPDLMGWSKDGIVYGCEIKNIGDRLSPTQKKFLNLMVLDNCQAFVAYAQADGGIQVKNWYDGSYEVIE